MLFIFGQYYKRIKRQTVLNVCPNCEAENSMELAVGCRTWHFMFIPIAPGAKRITQRCKACKTDYVPFTENKETGARMLAETRRPWYLYFLLYLIGFIVLYGIIMIIISSING